MHISSIIATALCLAGSGALALPLDPTQEAKRSPQYSSSEYKDQDYYNNRQFGKPIDDYYNDEYYNKGGDYYPSGKGQGKYNEDGYKGGDYYDGGKGEYKDGDVFKYLDFAKSIAGIATKGGGFGEGKGGLLQSLPVVGGP